MSATLGLDDSAYRQGIQNVQSETKKTVSSLSGEYSKAAKAVVELTRRYNESVGKTGKASSETKNLKTMLAQAEAQLRATTTALKAANNGMDGFASSTDKASGKSLAGAIAQGTIMAGVFSKLYAAALSAAEGFISSGIEYNAQIEKYTTGFTNMLGSAEAAQQVMSQIQEDAAKTPFDVESLTKANQYLISAGENASYARDTVMALGDAVSATGGGNDELNRMSQNLQQIANTGNATTADIKQFAYAGIDVYGILADYTGKSTAEVQNMTISYDLLTQALQAASEEGGRYYNSMDTQSQTMNGRVSTLQDNVKQLAGLLTGDLSSGIGVVIGNLNDMLVAAQEAYKTDGWIGLAGAITGLSGPISSVKSWFESFASSASTWLDKLSYKLNRFLGKAATADYDTYEEYADEKQKKSNRDRLRQQALAGVGISNKSWTERQEELKKATGDGTGSSIQKTGTTTTPKAAKSSTGTKKTVTESVISSQTDAATAYSKNAFGLVTTATTELTEKVLKSDGSSYDRFTKTVTESGKEMVNGVEKNYKTITKTVTGENGKVTSTTQKVYEDASKTLLNTLTNTTTKTVAGITTAIQRVTEKYADGSEHIKETQTETGQKIVDGVAQTYTKVTTYVDGFVNDVKESFEEVDRSWKATQERIENSASGISTESNKGIFGIIKNLVSGLKNQDWSTVGEQVFLLMWGEVDQSQQETLTNWALDAMKAINEAYAGGGLQSGLQSLVDLFANGIVPSANMASKEVMSFAKVMEGLSASGGIGGTLGSVGTSLGGIASSLSGVASTVISFVASNPWVLAIAAIAAGAAGLGIFIWQKYGKKKEAVTSGYESPYSATPVYDSLSEFSTRAAMITRYTQPAGGANTTADKQTSLLEQIRNMLDENLPNIGQGVLVLDGDKVGDMLAPRMASNIDARIGVTVQRNGRGV